jgi:hypothetical protein
MVAFACSTGEQVCRNSRKNAIRIRHETAMVFKLAATFQDPA